MASANHPPTHTHTHLITLSYSPLTLTNFTSSFTSSVNLLSALSPDLLPAISNLHPASLSLYLLRTCSKHVTFTAPLMSSLLRGLQKHRIKNAIFKLHHTEAQSSKYFNKFSVDSAIWVSRVALRFTLCPPRPLLRPRPSVFHRQEPVRPHTLVLLSPFQSDAPRSTRAWPSFPHLLMQAAVIRGNRHHLSAPDSDSHISGPVIKQSLFNVLCK